MNYIFNIAFIMYSIEKCSFKEKYTNMIPPNINILINGCKYSFHKEIAIKKYEFWNKYFSSSKNNEIDILGFSGTMSNEVINCAILLMYDDINFSDFNNKINSINNINILCDYINFLYDVLYILDLWKYQGKYPEILIRLIEKSLKFYEIMGSIVKIIIFNSCTKNIKHENYELIVSDNNQDLNVEFKIFNNLYPFSNDNIYHLNLKIKRRYEREELVDLQNIINLFGKLLNYTTFLYLYNHQKYAFLKNINENLIDLSFSIYKDKKNSASEFTIPNYIDKIITMSILNKKFFSKIQE